MDEKLTNIIEEVKNLTVLQLFELVKALEEFGVSAAPSRSCCCSRRRWW